MVSIVREVIKGASIGLESQKSKPMVFGKIVNVFEIKKKMNLTLAQDKKDRKSIFFPDRLRWAIAAPASLVVASAAVVLV